jgi:hypothetical protein
MFTFCFPHRSGVPVPLPQSTGATNVPKILAATRTDVANSTVATNVLSVAVPDGEWKDGGHIELKWWQQAGNATGVGQNISMRILCEGIELYATNFGFTSNPNERRRFMGTHLARVGNRIIIGGGDSQYSSPYVPATYSDTGLYFDDDDLTDSRGSYVTGPFAFGATTIDVEITLGIASTDLYYRALAPSALLINPYEA